MGTVGPLLRTWSLKNYFFSPRLIDGHFVIISPLYDVSKFSSKLHIYRYFRHE